MLSLYNLSPTKDGYVFTTQSGITYNLYFTEYYLKDANGEDISVQAFGFYTEPPLTRKSGMINKYDEKVRNTITNCIVEYFHANEEMGLLYVCSTEDGYARHRKIVFNQWYTAAGDPFIEKHDCPEKYSNGEFYPSILVRSDNPKKEYYVEAFYRGIEEFFG